MTRSGRKLRNHEGESNPTPLSVRSSVLERLIAEQDIRPWLPYGKVLQQHSREECNVEPDGSCEQDRSKNTEYDHVYFNVIHSAREPGVHLTGQPMQTVRAVVED